MYIKKQRLLTPGPTPLHPKALQAMMGSDIHHRTEDFRNLYRAVLADLKEVMGTSHDVLALLASGTGAMEASVSNFLSPGDRVIVCSAGKFGERWAELAKAFSLDAVVLKEEYAARYSRLGARYPDRRIAKGFHDPPRPGVSLH
jgi:aspartate aminotransferase-like enzyme